MMKSHKSASSPTTNQWLAAYYFLRAGVSLAWIALAVLLGRHDAALAALLLVIYPAWDAFANYLDARRNGGLIRNPTQTLNLVISAVVTVAIGWALTLGMPATIKVFGTWAILSGLLQLATAVRRWKTSSGQWVMILSGAQSAAAGVFFFKVAASGAALGVVTVAPYATLGAVYFLISAVWLRVRNRRRHANARAG